MTTPRFTTTRAKLGSPIVFDTEGKRPMLVCLRDTDMPHEAADVAAMRVAQLCTWALNRSHEEAQQSRKQRAGGR